MQEIEEPKINPKPLNNNDQTPEEISPYEQSRKERIKANLERMQKLGIVDLSLKLKSLTSPKRTPRNTPSSQKHPSPLQPSGPLRRSSRLHNVTPISYSEAALAKRDGLWEKKDVSLDEGSKPEVYTEEHEKLLGSTERSWKLFVDGYGSDGKRIYDQVKGKTCHQCRQKTLGHRTHCSKCQIVQGQFCGDCLFMRYGEHVLEALQNPNWICPVCRGICNCSLCRQGKGWAPTGPLYRKISSLGYKSVAHYLIQTRCSKTTVEGSLPTVNQVSAKRSLPFSNMETPSKRSHQINDEHNGPVMPPTEDMMHNELKTMKEKQLPDIRNLVTDGQTKRSLPFLNSKVQFGNVESIELNTDHEVHDHLGLSEPLFEDQIECELKCEKENLLHNSRNLAADGQTNISMPISRSEAESETLEPMIKDQKESELKSEKDGQLLNNGNLASDGQTTMPISGTEEQYEVVESAEVNNEVCDFGLVKPILEDKNSTNEEVKQLQSIDKQHDNSNIIIETCQMHKEKHALAFERSPDGIAARLRPRQQKSNGYGGAKFTGANEKIYDDVQQSLQNDLSNQQMEKAKELDIENDKHADSIAVSERSPIPNNKSASTAEPNPDSIGARLRQRRRMSKGFDDKVPEANEQNADTVQAFNNTSTMAEAGFNKKLLSITKPGEDSIARRLRSTQKLT
ncbi:uncharacterized protein LOC8260559 [Ricinus communis]|uniref:Zinc-finger domain-containing protein n=1 Tax=Ricinus communis TaxID=3988 RepID=B9S8P4_RICCO|nr:uncharacterized protein LOC8260559 [Ricinus communis]EEF40047.1 hypothetical protein RCOM_0603420 [Ricinus communis]|eukprot:XP_002522363.1 uncharacterized protein LOC8260559 [Ricinus communis]